MTSTVKPMGRPKKKEETESVRLPKSLAGRVRLLAAHRRQDVSDYLAGLIETLVKAEERKMMRELQESNSDSQDSPA